MKKITLTMLFLLLGAGSVGSAWADRGHFHGHFGVMIGPVWGWPWHYPPAPYPYYYPPYNPPLVIERAAPQVYIEQSPTAAPPPPAPPVAAAPENYWYYCAAAKGYYPYVKECRGGWQRVVPQPPDQR
jgi:hypothetical protein